MKKKYIIVILIVAILFLIFGFKDFIKGFKAGFSDGVKTEQSK